MTPEEVTKLQADLIAGIEARKQKEAEAQVTPEQVDTMSAAADSEASELSQPTRNPSAVPNGAQDQINNEINKAQTPPLSQEKTPLQVLLEKSNALREKSAADMKAASEQDRKDALYANLAKAAGSLGAASVQAKTGYDVGLKEFNPVAVKDSSSKIGKNRDALISQLQNEFKLMQAGKPKGITDYQKATLDSAKEDRKLKEKLAGAKAKVMGFAEKETLKSDLKAKNALEKSNRESMGKSKTSIEGIDKQIKNVKKAQRLLKKLTKNTFFDTGPLDQYAASATDDGQALRQALNELSLDKMVKMFAGMSKAIDSDAERAFFAQSQANMGSYPKINAEILARTLKDLEGYRATEQANINSFTKKGEIKEVPRTNEVKRMTKDGRTAIFNADTKEFIRYE